MVKMDLMKQYIFKFFSFIIKIHFFSFKNIKNLFKYKFDLKVVLIDI
jgi:hypothetical protein